MQNFNFGNYQIQITEKTDLNWKQMCYPEVQTFYCCKQIHSDQIHEWKPGWNNNIEGDGLYSNVKWIALKIGVSDCNPLIIMGEEWFWIVHAWWKGLKQWIIQKMMQKLQEKWEKSFNVFIWPSIRKCCYEVGEEFTTRCDSSFLNPKENGKFCMDMLGMIKEILKNFPCKEIYTHPECTKCGTHFFSHRKGDGINNLILVSKK